MAERLLKETISEDEKLIKAFRLIISRAPTSKEKSILVEYFQSELKDFNQSSEKVERLMSVGEYAKDKPSVASAALMETILMMYNMDEAIVK